MTKNPGKLIVTTLGELIEGFCGSLVPRASLPLILTAIDLAAYTAVHDDHLRVGRKYSQHARDTYPHPRLEESPEDMQPFADMDEGDLFKWWSAFWAWREMLTPHDFQTLNSERVVMSEVLS